MQQRIQINNLKCSYKVKRIIHFSFIFYSFMFYVIWRINLALNNIQDKITFDFKFSQISCWNKIENEYFRNILKLLINLTMVSSIFASFNKLNMIFELFYATKNKINNLKCSHIVKRIIHFSFIFFSFMIYVIWRTNLALNNIQDKITFDFKLS